MCLRVTILPDSAIHWDSTIYRIVKVRTFALHNIMHMLNAGKQSKIGKIILWVVLILLSLSFMWSAFMKLITPPEQLASMWPWTAGNEVLTRVTGVADLLIGLGLIFPKLLRIQPGLTRYASYATI